ncbi:hypothetical protein B0H17DRAFT_1209840 [Mycena rosella]|uniref:Uncharacterized protein n=1 Tax=Mycena rosella TaxID=1033263 RepID=A0AAD7CYW6_MYCRO|nr:hypothetical protein B0H17DRAFT_1209840 [Mycena rosella]
MATTADAASTLPTLSGAAAATSSSTHVAPSAVKRAFDDAIATLGTVPISSNKRTKRATIETKSPLEKLLSCAKYFVCAVDPYMDIALVLFHGSQAHWAAPTIVCPSSTTIVSSEHLAEQKRHIDAFDRMFSISPESVELLREFYKVPVQWTRIVAKLRAAAKNARQTDTSGLKHKLGYLLSDPSKCLVPPIPETTSKSDRGINHPMLRDAIVPWRLRNKINARVVAEEHDEETPNSPAPPEASLTPEATEALKALMNGKLTNGKPALIASRYPSCFYADGSYDPKDPEKGLFRSPFLLRVVRHIWTTPSSAMDGADKLRGNARAHGQFKVIGRMIGYGCVQGRTMLCTSDWADKDGAYNYEKLFNSVVELFESDTTDPWVTETLQWGVFGKATKSGGSSDSDDDDDDDNDSDSVSGSILERRAARRSTASSASSRCTLLLAQHVLSIFFAISGSFLSHDFPKCFPLSAPMSSSFMPLFNFTNTVFLRFILLFSFVLSG